MKLSTYFWILPFLCFMTGYYAVRLLCMSSTLATPNLIGKDLFNALTIASGHNLNLRILNEKEDADLPPGIILSQTPHAGSSMKPHQSIFLLISKKPATTNVPSFFSKSRNEIEAVINKIGAHAKFYEIECNYPSNTCIGQSPTLGTLLPKDAIVTLYMAQYPTKRYLMPTLMQKPVPEVIDFLTEHGLKTEIIHAIPQPHHHQCDHCRITHQRPSAGSLITLHEKAPLIQLQVTPY